MRIKFGPAGLGGVKDAVSNLEEYSKLGLKACEIAFTYGIYIKKQEDAVRIGEAAKRFGISLSIHAPYWINLNSADKKKIEESKQRILKCLEVGTWLKAEMVVFHPGFYGKFGGQKAKPLATSSTSSQSKEETYENIKKAILELQEERKKKRYIPKLAPETTGKINVFGSIDEISKLAEETKCEFCIDFAHILAREKSYNFEKIKKKFGKYTTWHVHFSGIEYSEKGEKHHKKTTINEMKKLLSNLPKNKNFTIINESPDPIEDSVLGLKLHNKKNVH